MSAINVTDSKPMDVLRELHEYGQAYHAIYSETAATTQRVRDAYDRLIRLNVTTAMPLLVWLITLDSTRLSAVDHERAVLAVESWVVRRMLRGANTRGYSSAFLNVLKAARSAEQRGGDIADAIIDALDASSPAFGWPGDVELTQIFKDKPLYRDLSQERVRMLFGAVDEEMQARNRTDPEASFNYDRLQIEHIMPQQWRPSWPISADASTETEYLRDIAVHTAGNLTLVTPTFNRAVSNGPWSAKRPEFINQTKLEINRGIGGIDDWNEAAIAARGAALASATADVWLPPERLRSAQFQERANRPAPPTGQTGVTTVPSATGPEGGGESARVPALVHAGTISWNPPGRGSDMLRRADGARYKTGTGSTGTYEWVVKDGLWAAYFYPGGVQTQTPVVLLAPQSSDGKAYRACVDHNNAAS